MQYSEAIKELLSIVDADPGSVKSVESRLLGFSQKPGAIDETISTLESAVSKNKPYYSYLLASVYREAGRYSDALNLLKKIDLPVMNNGGEIFSLASAAAADDDFASAANAYSFIISEYPKSPFVSQAKLGLAKNISRAAYLRGADSTSEWKPYSPQKKYFPELFRDAIAAYREIIKTFPHTDAAIEAHYSLAKIYYETDEPAEAEIFVNEITKNYPMSVYFGQVILLSAEKKIAAGDLDGAAALLDRLIAAQGNANRYRTDGLFLKAKLAFYNGNFTAATNIINGIYTELRDNRVNDALEFSLLTNVNLSDSASLAEFAVAELRMIQGKTKEAYPVYESLSKNNNLYMLKYFASVRLIEIDIADGRYDSAVTKAAAVSGEKLNIFADKAAYYACLARLNGLKDSAGAAAAMEAFMEKFPASLYFDKIRALLVNLQNKNI